eukprot:768740-Hanusia_phi.AAC.2
MVGKHGQGSESEIEMDEGRGGERAWERTEVMFRTAAGYDKVGDDSEDGADSDAFSGHRMFAKCTPALAECKLLFGVGEDLQDDREGRGGQGMAEEIFGDAFRSPALPAVAGRSQETPRAVVTR